MPFPAHVYFAPRRPRRLGVAVLPDDGEEDDAHPDAAEADTRTHVQRIIMRCIDARRVALVRQGMSDRADIAGLNRMDDLQDKGQDHTWMWALSKHRGPVMDDEDHIEAVRLRLGIVGPIDVVPCGLCGDTVMDNSGAHALCCARAESTKGHHCVTRQLADEIRCADPTVEVEPGGACARH